MGWMTGVQFLERTEIFLLSTTSRLALGPHPPYCPVGTRGSLFLRGEASGAWSWILTSF